MANATRKDPIQVPVCMTGLVAREEISFCMDGATHVLRNVGVNVRLKARNRQVEEELSRAEGKRANFTACGYLVRGPECDYLSTYSLEPAHALMKRLDDLKSGIALFSADGPGNGGTPHPEPGPRPSPGPGGGEKPEKPDKPTPSPGPRPGGSRSRGR